MSVNTLTDNPIFIGEIVQAVAPLVSPAPFFLQVPLGAGSHNTYTIINQNVNINALPSLVTVALNTPAGLTSSGGNITCEMTVSGAQVYSQTIPCASETPTCNVFTTLFTPSAANPHIQIVVYTNGGNYFDFSQIGFASLTIMQ